MTPLQTIPSLDNELAALYDRIYRLMGKSSKSTTSARLTSAIYRQEKKTKNSNEWRKSLQGMGTWKAFVECICCLDIVHCSAWRPLIFVSFSLLTHSNPLFSRSSLPRRPTSVFPAPRPEKKGKEKETANIEIRSLFLSLTATPLAPNARNPKRDR